MGEAYIKGAYSTDKTHVALGSHEQRVIDCSYDKIPVTWPYKEVWSLSAPNVTPSGYAPRYYIIHLGLTMIILPYKAYDNYYMHTYIYIYIYIYRRVPLISPPYTALTHTCT